MNSNRQIPCWFAECSRENPVRGEFTEYVFKSIKETDLELSQQFKCLTFFTALGIHKLDLKYNVQTQHKCISMDISILTVEFVINFFHYAFRETWIFVSLFSLEFDTNTYACKQWIWILKMCSINEKRSRKCSSQTRNSQTKRIIYNFEHHAENGLEIDCLYFFLNYKTRFVKIKATTIY